MTGTNQNPRYPGANWQKSSTSGHGSDCVEVADISYRIAIRDSKRPAQDVLTFASTAFEHFIRTLVAPSQQA